MTEETEVALPTVHVAAAIIQRDGLILAARRAHGMDGWEFPGGKVEPGETSEEACRREVTEELGCKLQVMCGRNDCSNCADRYCISVPSEILYRRYDTWFC